MGYTWSPYVTFWRPFCARHTRRGTQRGPSAGPVKQGSRRALLCVHVLAPVLRAPRAPRRSAQAFGQRQKVRQHMSFAACDALSRCSARRHCHGPPSAPRWAPCGALQSPAVGCRRLRSLLCERLWQWSMHPAAVWRGRAPLPRGTCCQRGLHMAMPGAAPGALGCWRARPARQLPPPRDRWLSCYRRKRPCLCVAGAAAAAAQVCSPRQRGMSLQLARSRASRTPPHGPPLHILLCASCPGRSHLARACWCRP